MSQSGSASAGSMAKANRFLISRLALIVVATSFVGGCQGRESPSPRIARASGLESGLSPTNPAFVGESDPCYVHTARELRRIYDVAPTTISRNILNSFDASSIKGRIVAVFPSGDKACKHLLGLTIIPPAYSSDLFLDLPDFSIRSIEVKASSTSRQATLVVTDNARRTNVVHLVARPFAFVVDYATDSLELWAPGRDEITKSQSTNFGSRIGYLIYMKHGFSFDGPHYNM